MPFSSIDRNPKRFLQGVGAAVQLIPFPPENLESVVLVPLAIEGASRLRDGIYHVCRKMKG